jgi:hypothetical protein
MVRLPGPRDGAAVAFASAAFEEFNGITLANSSVANDSSNHVESGAARLPKSPDPSNGRDFFFFSPWTTEAFLLLPESLVRVLLRTLSSE